MVFRSGAIERDIIARVGQLAPAGVGLEGQTIAAIVISSTAAGDVHTAL